MIKNIVFDFGDVFIDLDKSASMRLLLEKYPGFVVNEKIEAINNQYEIGLISTDGFLNAYKEFFPSENNETLRSIWNAIILHIPKHRFKFIQSLANENKYRLFLLSNTNALHIEKVIQNISEERFLAFKKCFEKFYLSHEIHLRKPNNDIFEFVLNDNNIHPEETLFIDDTHEHIQTAKQLGLYTWHLIPGRDDVTQLLSQPFPFKP